MSRKKKLHGKCHICSNVGELTFEHIPPKKAFNNKRTIQVKFEQMLTLGPDERVKGPIKQGGVGAYTLCGRCNNFTGKWYAPSFIQWCYQGAQFLIRSGGKPTLIYMHYLHPLPILKEIVTMFFSVNADTFCDAHPELVRFVLNKEHKYLPPRYHFYAYYNFAGNYRYVSITAKVDINSGNIRLMSEITYPPFGYLMTLDKPVEEARLFEITHFANYRYNDFKVMSIKMPVLPTHLPYLPGDYRTKEEILKQVEISREYEKIHHAENDVKI